MNVQIPVLGSLSEMIETTFKSSVGISMVFIVNSKVTQEGDFVIRRITILLRSRKQSGIDKSRGL